MVKTCTKCKHSQPLLNFYKDISCKDGRQRWCKDCHRQHRRDNAEHYRKYQNNWLKCNGKGAKRQAKYRKRHGENYRIRENLWAKSKKGRSAAKSSKFRADKLKATPKWLTKVDFYKIREIYKNCPIGHHVDHIIPLRGKNVCGLHVPSNLQYLPIKDNLKKSNKF